MIKSLRIIVQGKVQGVGFRYFAYQKANELNLTGSVENLDDGSVKVIAIGQNEKLSAYIHLLREGPPFSRVSSVNFDEIEYSLEHNSFKIVRS
ncbi:acylphosphatase [bacterium]|nr:MAG: acylphosphatase [bacterium]